MSDERNQKQETGNHARSWAIGIEQLRVHRGNFHLYDINLSVEKGEFFSLIGPTGAGKTVLLEAITGLIPVKHGNIFIEGRQVTRLPPEKRGISIVYQDQALFPHLTVLDNITYGLHFHKIDPKERKRRLHTLVEALNIGHLEKRLPIHLSGGELQRVALARALMVHPSVLLLDEPLSALDPRFKEEIRKGLKELHQSSGTTFLMVTHDFTDVLSLSDRGAVMSGGKIEQVGNIDEIFQKPASPFVAGFVGMKNLFAVNFSGSQAITNGLAIELGRSVPNSHGYIAIRSEDLVLSRETLASSMRNTFRATVSGVFNQGFYFEVQLQIRGVTFAALITKKSLFELDIEPGKDIFLSFKSTAVHSF